MTVTKKPPEKPITQKLIKTIHIDTSLQIERCKEPKKARIVEQRLKDFGFTSTSSYAKFEFKCAWLRDLVYLYSASHKVRRVEQLIGYVNDRLNAHPVNRRRVNRCLEAIVAYLSRVPGELSYAAAFLRLRTHILEAIISAYPWWEQSTYHEYDGTGCVRANEQPKRRAGGFLDMSIPQCRVKNIKCTVHQFFEKNKELFIAIKFAIESLGKNASKELQKAKKIIENAEKKPENLCDDSNCRKLGDILIAIDGFDMDYFAANNDKEWELLSQVLGKELVNPVREAKKMTSQSKRTTQR